jgi:uncharacterized membrane protein YeaQ/YmgE (transglycosylase-associated protein family)
MEMLIRALLGAIAGWLTGKAVEGEGRATIVREKHGRDAIYGMIGGLFGEYLFFWIIIGKGDAFTTAGTAVLGAIVAVGLARLLHLSPRSRQEA